jgi:hypothetical protein
MRPASRPRPHPCRRLGVVQVHAPGLALRGRRERERTKKARGGGARIAAEDRTTAWQDRRHTGRIAAATNQNPGLVRHAGSGRSYHRLNVVASGCRSCASVARRRAPGPPFPRRRRGALEGGRLRETPCPHPRAVLARQRPGARHAVQRGDGTGISDPAADEPAAWTGRPMPAPTVEPRLGAMPGTDGGVDDRRWTERSSGAAGFRGADRYWQPTRRPRRWHDRPRLRKLQRYKTLLNRAE